MSEGTAYQSSRRAIITQVRRGDGRCCAPECIHERDGGSRDIHPDARVEVHRDSRGDPTGPLHYRCAQSIRGKKGIEAQSGRFLRL